MKKRTKNQLAGKDLMAALESVCKDLVYISETDAQIEPVKVEAASGPTLLKAAAKHLESPEKNIVEHSAQEFFEKLTAEREWHRDREKKRVKGFVKLHDLLTSNLTELRVFRSGRVRINILVIGFDVERSVVGIQTSAVET